MNPRIEKSLKWRLGIEVERRTENGVEVRVHDVV